MASSGAQRYYLAEGHHGFWRWDAESVVSWRDGATIAFRWELLEILKTLESEGLPPFGAVLLALAALRPGWGERSRPTEILRQDARALDRSGDDVHRELRASVSRGLFRFLQSRVEEPERVTLSALVRVTLGELDRWHEASSARAVNAPEKGFLLQHLFEGNSARGDVSTAKETIAELARGIPGIEVTVAAESDRRLELRRFALPLTAILESILRNVLEGLDSRLRTGLDAPPEPAPIEPGSREGARELLDGLRDDPELGGVARLALNMMAVTHLPRRVADPEDLPTGGLTDISNRGRLDRLLLSELANDDLTLAVRIALDEALYLRREAPPSDPQGTRLILVDAGIRMWGVPRVFATAVALALAATAEVGEVVRVFHPAGAELVEVELCTREGLEQLLAALCTEPDPGAALPRLTELCAERLTPLDVTLITHRDTLADADFLRALGREFPAELYAATVDDRGHYRLQLHGALGSRGLDEARLDLDELLTVPRRGPSNATEEVVDDDLPLYFSLCPPPLRLCVTTTADHVAFRRDVGLVTTTRYGTLLHWDEKRRGAREVARGLPFARPRFIGIDDDGAVVLVYGPHWETGSQLVRVDLTTGEHRTGPIDAKVLEARGVELQEGALFFLYQNNAESFDVATGAFLGELGTDGPSPKWGHGRSYFAADSFFILARGVRVPELVEDPHMGGFPNWSFEREGHAGLWEMDRKGNVRHPGTHELVKPRGLADVETVNKMEVSPDGHRLLVTYTRLEEDRSTNVVVDLEAGGASYGHDEWWPFSPEIRQYLTNPAQVLRRVTRIESIGLAPSRRAIVLFNHDGRRLVLSLSLSTEPIWEYHDSTPHAELVASFDPIAAPAGAPSPLLRACWPDGSRAYLDGRGYLHLKSSDEEIPEVTLLLTLAQSEIVIWSTGGQAFGDPRVTGGLRTVEFKEIAAHLLRFIFRVYSSRGGAS